MAKAKQGAYRLLRVSSGPAVSVYKHTLSTVPTTELTESKANSSVSKACLSVFPDIAYPHARSAYNNQAVNMSEQWAERNAALPSQQQPLRLLYSLHINIKEPSREHTNTVICIHLRCDNTYHAEAQVYRGSGVHKVHREFALKVT